MNLEQSHASPFSHLDPGLWRRTKSTHITLTVIGTLLLLPACCVFFALWQVSPYWSSFNDTEVIFPLGSALIGTFSGCFAWCALCFLFFMRCDVRCHRIVWKICAIFGYLTIPCATGWILWILSENAPPLFFFILAGILTAAIACARVGTRYSRLASDILERNRAAHRPVHGLQIK
ncbi:hypothetical protein [Haloferula sp.]|uniref:hypothetical protein n=1 Tax=Haloferula sp. TaxID=2497595 RepID=UPI00329BFE7B